MAVILRRADIRGRLTSVKVAGTQVVEVGDDVGPMAADDVGPTAADDVGPAGDRDRIDHVIDAEGGALLPGLHDHHLHLMAMAAADTSVKCGPPEVTTLAQFEAMMSRAVQHPSADGWIRAVGYHESIAGLLDRDALDRLTGAVPVRVQHRGGGLWMVNSAAIERLGLEFELSESASPIERDEAGRATGRVWRGDQLLRDRLGGTPPDLAGVSRRLASYGVTGVTDATWTTDSTSAGWITAAQASGQLAQRVRLMGPCSLRLPEEAGADSATVTLGEVKVMLDDDALPSLESLTETVAAAHAAHRGVAVHCVTAAQLYLALHALEDAGVAGDRIEHASVIPPEARSRLKRLGLRVVTQPGLVSERGDRYREDVDQPDRVCLYPLRSLLDAGVPVAGSTDAPLTAADPWRAMRAAVDRRSVDGEVLGAGERITPAEALHLFLRPAGDVAAPARRVRPGTPADLVLLAEPTARVLERFDANDVVLTMIAGEVVFDRR